MSEHIEQMLKYAKPQLDVGDYSKMTARSGSISRPIIMIDRRWAWSQRSTSSKDSGYGIGSRRIGTWQVLAAQMFEEYVDESVHVCPIVRI